MVYKIFIGLAYLGQPELTRLLETHKLFVTLVNISFLLIYLMKIKITKSPKYV